MIQQIEELANNLNVGNLMLLLQFGNMGKERTKYNTELLAKRVMPKPRDKFGEWEHGWWLRPMDILERAELTAFEPRQAAE